MARTQVQLHFHRDQDGNGNFHTHASFIRSEDFSQHHERGLLHRTMALRERVTGDTYSFRKHLQSIEPQTLHGKTALNITKGSYTFLRSSGSAALHTALAAESGMTKADEVIGKQTVMQFKQKWRSEARDDADQGLLVGAGLAVDMYKGIQNAHRHEADYQFERHRLCQRRSETEHFELRKSPHPESKKLQRQEQRVGRTLQRRQRSQERIVNLSRPNSTGASVALYAGGKAAQTARSKAIEADESNDFVTAADKAISLAQQAVPAKEQRLQHERRREHQLQQRQSQQQARLKLEENRLTEQKKNPKWKKQKGTASASSSGSGLQALKKELAQLGSSIKGSLASISGKVALITLPIMLVLLCFSGVAMMVMSFFQNSSFIMGTYNAQDKDLTEAATYYSKMAWELNQKILAVPTDWKDALKDLGVDTKKYYDTPAEFIYGSSAQFAETAGYDFDPYKLWSFLCAYNYDFAESYRAEAAGESPDINDWTMTTSNYGLITSLFQKEYSFEHYYQNESHWEYRDSFIDPADGGWYAIEGCGTINIGENIYGFMDYAAMCPEVTEFADGNRLYYNLENGEILNYNRDYAATGWYWMNQCGTTTDNSGNVWNGWYYWTDYGWMYGSGIPRNGGYSIEYDVNGVRYDVVHVITSLDWANFNYPEERYYERLQNGEDNWESIHVAMALNGHRYMYAKPMKFYDWSEDCILYYNIKQKCTFEEAILDMLTNKDGYGTDRVEYYKMLVYGNDSVKAMYGNHQSLYSPVNVGIEQLITSGGIYNNNGWDMQGWNQTHCGLSDQHYGMDIVCDTGTPIRAPMDCKITEVDASTGKMVLESTIEPWYDGTNDEQRPIRITYYNVNIVPVLYAGTEVPADTVIGLSTNGHYCPEQNSAAVYDYIHCTIEIAYNKGRTWSYIDPRLLITYN